jgi:uncharacterized cysteine cluster protein YcgN (CxxCxxCC family)
MRERFWETVPLGQLTSDEWEALCDGCGKCCLHKLEDEDTAEIFYTCVSCRLLDTVSCRCTSYPNRRDFVPDCVSVSVETLPGIAYWLPDSCAYKLLWQGNPLAWWHPLLSGDPATVHRAGQSLAGAMIPETEVDEDDLEAHIVNGIVG